MALLRYILIASVCLSLFYLAYRLVFKREEHFRQMRMFLLLSVAISLLIPLYTGRIDVFSHHDQQVALHYNIPVHAGTIVTGQHIKETIDWPAFMLKVYLGVAAFLVLRILLQLLVLTWHYFKSEKIRRQEYILLIDQQIRTTFSFFDWIFIHPANLQDEEFEQIIAHEKVHARQYHSVDLVIMELLACLMWFNPLIWMMKNSIQLVHEYLADEGVINSGVDKLKYQALLINQAGEDKLISLFSGFNHSLIKKRMKKMLNTRLNKGSRFKWAALLPISLCLILLMAVFNGLFTRNTEAAVTNPGDAVGFSSGYMPAPRSFTGDTIKKKVIKIVNHNGKIDTTVDETFDIAADNDIQHDAKVYTYETIVKDGDSSHYKYVVNEGDPYKIMVDVDNDADVFVTNDTHKNVRKEVKVITYVSVQPKDTIPSNTLVIIDGVKHTEKNALASLDPDKIESMNVIKDKKMMKQYTDKDYGGVIIIKTKQAKK